MSFFEDLFATARAVHEKKAPKESLRDCLSNLESVVADTRKELEADAKPEFQEEMADLESAFAKFNDGAKLIGKYLEKDHSDSLDNGLNAIEGALQEIKSGISRIGLHKAALSPSKDPGLNLLMNMGASLQKGTCPNEVFESSLNFYEEYFHQVIRGIRRLNRTAQSNAEMQAVLEKYPLDIEAASQALAQVRASFAKGAYGELNGSFEIMHKFADGYQTLNHELGQVLEKKKEKKCPRCFHVNDYTARVCASCSFVFPDFEISASDLDIVEGGGGKQKFVMTYNLQKVLDAIEAYQDGEVAAENVAEVLEWMSAKLEFGMERYRTYGKKMQESLNANPVATKELKAALSEMIEIYKAGVAEMQDGVSLLKRWISSGQESDCKDGTKRLVQGAARIQDVVTRSENIVVLQKGQNEQQGDEFAGSVS